MLIKAGTDSLLAESCPCIAGVPIAYDARGRSMVRQVSPSCASRRRREHDNKGRQGHSAAPSCLHGPLWPLRKLCEYDAIPWQQPCLWHDSANGMQLAEAQVAWHGAGCEVTPRSGVSYARVRHVCRLHSGADASLQDADGQTALDKAAAQVSPVLSSVSTLKNMAVLTWLVYDLSSPEPSVSSRLVLYAGPWPYDTAAAASY